MGKRSAFERRPNDFYATPMEPVGVLAHWLRPGVAFAEPCAGDGALIRHLEHYGHRCVYACDIDPQAQGIERGDARRLVAVDGCEMFITNPPWDREVLHDIIANLASIMPTWLLFDADWMHTLQARPYLEYCERILAVGRVRWIAGTDNDGMDNACWYLFGQDRRATAPAFHGRIW